MLGRCRLKRSYVLDVFFNSSGMLSGRQDSSNIRTDGLHGQPADFAGQVMEYASVLLRGFSYFELGAD